MSAPNISYIFNRIQSTKSENALIQEILHFTDRRGRSGEVAHETLAQRLGKHVRTIYRLIASLEEKNQLRVKRGPRLGPKQCPTNIYTVVLPWLREFDWRLQKQILHKRATDKKCQGNPNTKTNPTRTHEEKPKTTPEFCRWLGLTEGSEPYTASVANVTPQRRDHAPITPPVGHLLAGSR